MNNFDDLRNLLTSGFTNWQQYGDVYTKEWDDLVLFNYSPAAQFAARWNWFETVSRGLIMNRTTGEIVARPFDKFWNWLESGRKARGHIVTVTEKLDGSLGILFRHKGEYHIATRGSFESDQALWATEHWRSYYRHILIPDEWTLLFEIVYPQNRVVVDYGDTETLVLLAIRNRYTGDYLPFFPTVYEFADEYVLDTPEVYTFNDVGKIIETCGQLDADHEGFVVEFSDASGEQGYGQRFKFKGDRYLELHRLITSLPFKNTLKAMQNNELDQLLATVPDEFHGQLNQWIDEIQSTIATIRQRVDSALQQAPLYTGFDDKTARKLFAKYVMENHRDLQGYLFACYDGRDITDLIYRNAFKDRTDHGPTESL